MPLVFAAGAQAAPSGSAADAPPGVGIIDGHRAKPGEFPWMVRLDVVRTDGGLEGFCDGSMIAKDLVLTARHCAPGNDRVVVAGVTDLQDPHAIMDKVVDYRTSDDADWQVLKLERPLDLPTLNLADNPRGNRGVFDVIGWGVTQDEPGAKSSRYLMTAEVPYMDDRACAKASSDFDPAHEMCTGPQKPGGSSPCYGDSGGPLVRRDGDGHWIEVGIVSHGDSCSKTGSAAVYVKVSAEYPQIRQAMRELGG